MRFTTDAYPKTSMNTPNREIVAFAARLRENPGVWMQYPRTMTLPALRSTASRINTGNRAPRALCGAFAAKVSEGRLFVRFLDATTDSKKSGAA